MKKEIYVLSRMSAKRIICFNLLFLFRAQYFFFIATTTTTTASKHHSLTHLRPLQVRKYVFNKKKKYEKEEINYLIVNPMQLNVKYAVVIIIFSTAHYT